MKILCVHQGYELYGSDRSFISTLTIFRSVFPNCEIEVILPKEGPLYDFLIIEGYFVTIQSIAKLSKQDFKKLKLRNLFQPIFQLKNRVRQANRYDLIYINTIVVLDFILASYFFKPKCIVHVREIPTGVLKYFSRLILNNSGAHLIFNSYATKSVFLSKKIEMRNNVVHNGVKKIVETNNIETNELKIMIMGRLLSWKGQYFFLDSFAKNRHKFINKVSIRIVGSSFEDQTQYSEELKELVDKNKMHDTVDFIEFVPDPASQYNWANLVLIPSTKPEPFGRVAIEAMSVGRPVVAADHGGLSEIVIQNNTGYLFVPNDANSIVEYLIKFDKDQTLFLSLGENGRKRYLEEFTEDIYQQKLANLFKQIMMLN